MLRTPCFVRRSRRTLNKSFCDSPSPSVFSSRHWTRHQTIASGSHSTLSNNNAFPSAFQPGSIPRFGNALNSRLFEQQRNSRHPFTSSASEQSTADPSSLSSSVSAEPKDVRTATDEVRAASKRGLLRNDLSEEWSVGTRIPLPSGHAFVVDRVTPIPGYECTVYEMTHSGTGGRYLHVDAADTNNAFGVILKTLPTDDTGVAHVLEHTALCGSEKFPVRDPFFHMLRRSLNTFMNALTSADWTCYPFATQNEQDYHHLLSVYLDSVFFPKLDIRDFMQEGHRFDIDRSAEEKRIDDFKAAKEAKAGTLDATVIETEEVEEMNEQQRKEHLVKEGELVYRGVVFNEMKGNFGEPNEVMSTEMRKHLFDQNIYQHNFGGDPAQIPDLTYEHLRQFHEDFYHPSNCYFYSYGDLRPCLEEIDTLVLSKFEHNSAASEIEVELQPMSDQKKYVEVSIPAEPTISDPLRQTRLLMAWVCNPVADVEETFGLSVLSQLLLAGPNAPLHRALIDTKLATGFSPITGYDMDTNQGVFVVGLSRIKESDIKDNEKTILSTLEKCVSEGFPPERVQSILHQFEIEHKEKSGNFGLNLLFRMISLMIHDGEPSAALKIDDLLMNVQRKVLGREEPKYFENLIEKYFLNPENEPLTLVGRARKTYVTQKSDQERERLNKIAAAMTDDDKMRVLDEAQALEDYQNAEQDESCLPTLKVSDIPVQAPADDPTVVEPYTFEILDDFGERDPIQAKTTVMTTQTATNDMVYVRQIFDMRPLFGSSNKSREIQKNNFHMLMPLYTTLLTQLGAGQMDVRQLAQKIESYTGGIEASCIAVTPADRDYYRDGSGIRGYDKMNYVLELEGKCLSRNSDHMLQLMEDIAMHPEFQYPDRVEHLLTQKIEHATQLLLEGGHSYAVVNAAAAFGDELPATLIAERLEGISQLKFLGQLCQMFRNNRFGLMKELTDLCHTMNQALFRKQGPIKTQIIADEAYLQSKRYSTDRLMNPFTPNEYVMHRKLSSTLLPQATPNYQYTDIINEWDDSSDSDEEETNLEGPEHESRLWSVGKLLLGQVLIDSHEIGTRDTNEGTSMTRMSALGPDYDKRKEHIKAGTVPEPRPIYAKNFVACPMPINFCAMVAPTVPLTHPDCAPLRVAAKILSQHYLHNEIREKGGAYGSGATQNKHLFAMYSYRDPNHTTTVDKFRDSVDWLVNQDSGQMDKYVDQALLSLFGHLDSPKNPSELGYQQFLQDITPDQRQAHREQLLSVDTAAVKEAVEKYLGTAVDNDAIGVCIVGDSSHYKDKDSRERIAKQGYNFINLD